MSLARSQHPNAPLTPEGSRRMVECVLVKEWTIEATAERFQVDAKMVPKWRERFCVEDEVGWWERAISMANGNCRSFAGWHMLDPCSTFDGK